MLFVSCQPAASRNSEILHDGVAPARSSVPLHFNANQLERFLARENHSSKQRSRNCIAQSVFQIRMIFTRYPPQRCNFLVLIVVNAYDHRCFYLNPCSAENNFITSARRREA
jgi:hypothetical protein